MTSPYEGGNNAVEIERRAQEQQAQFEWGLALKTASVSFAVARAPRSIMRRA